MTQPMTANNDAAALEQLVSTTISRQQLQITQMQIALVSLQRELDQAKRTIASLEDARDATNVPR